MQTINIGFGVNDYYAKHLGTLVYSLLKYTPDSNFNIYVLNDGINEDTLLELYKLEKNYANLTFNFLKVTSDKLDGISLDNNRLPISSYYRFLLADLLPTVDKIIYMDVDMLIRKSIKALWETDLEDYPIAAVKELDIYRVFANHFEDIGFNYEDNYFNSGLIIYNLKKFRTDNISRQLLDFAKANAQKYVLGDQDILNIFFKNNFKLLDPIYNWTRFRLQWDEFNDDEAVIFHFNGNGSTKPWISYSEMPDYLHQSAKLYKQETRDYYKTIGIRTHSKNAVAYIVKGSHTQLLAVSLASLVNNYQSEEELDIILIEDFTVPKDKEFITQIPSIYNKNHIRVILSRPPAISKFVEDVKVEISPIVLWRMVLTHEYPDYDKILYLDNDTILYCDVNELFDQVADDKIIGAIPDFYFYVQSDIEDYGGNYGLKTAKNYFNAGVLVFNVANFSQAYSVEQIIDLIKNNTYPWPDQTLLNIMCEDKTSLLPLAYNYQKNDYWLNEWACHVSEKSSNDIIQARKNVKIRHFIEYNALSMPWEHLFVENEFEMDFWNYLYFLKQHIYIRK